MAEDRSTWLCRDGGRVPHPVRRSGWWREILIIALFYGIYTLIRDLRGDEPVSAAAAFTNARRIIRFERWFGVFHEAGIQHRFLSERGLIRFCDDFYGTAHFVAPVVVLVVLFFWFPERYRYWRNVLASVTALALLGFYFFPLMPPRLLPAGYHFVDTLQTVGGLWNFSNGPVNDISNQYAAMPSLHTAWSAWCATVVMALVRRWWARLLVLAYPAFTIFAIVVTANHYFADAAAGLLLLALSIWLSHLGTGRLHALRARPGGSSSAPLYVDAGRPAGAVSAQGGAGQSPGIPVAGPGPAPGRSGPG